MKEEIKCQICSKRVVDNSHYINGKYYHNDCIEQLQQDKEDLIKKPKVIVQNKLKEITEEYHKLDKKNLNTANIIAHQYNSMRTVLEEVLYELKESDKDEC